MRTILLIILFILIPVLGFAQSDSEIDRLIDSLSWNSITTSHSWHTFTLDYQDSIVKELIEIGKPASNRLLNSIEIPDKTVIIHIILTKILEPNNGNDNLPIKYIYKDCDDLLGWHHIYNGLIWEWFSETNYVISDSEIVKVSDYWKSRINQNSDSWTHDVNDIFDTLFTVDSLKYPCKRIYDNNSVKLDIENLLSLLGSNYPSEKFNEIFSVLGNDSTISRHSDCYFISFGADGVDFRFDMNNNLTTLFFEPTFKGELISGLRMSDSKNQILRKLGTPDKSRENWIWYDKNEIGIDFYSDQKIKTLQINKQ